MSTPIEDALADALVGLARAVDPSIDAGDERTAVVAHIEGTDLIEDGTPPWLVDILDAAGEGRVIPWTDMTGGGDMSGPMALLRGLPRVVPCVLRDDVESLTLTFEPVDREVTVSWEGSCYRVVEIGAAWE